MYRNNEQLFTSDVMNFVLNHGALGDVITSLPPIMWARQHYGVALRLKVWGPSWQHELLDHLLKPYGEFEILDFEDFPKKGADRLDWGGGPVAVNQMAFNTHTRNRVHMVDFAFNCLLDSQPESMAERNYPTAAPLARPVLSLYDSAAGYVVFPVGATSNNKLFKAAVMAPVIKWCRDNGYVPVLVGTKTSHTKLDAGGELTPIVLRDEVDKLPAELFAECIDMREKTTLVQLRSLLGHASAVVGVDGGTLHLAGTTDTSIVFMSGTTLPKHRYVARHGNPNYKIRYVGPRNLQCAGCQSNWAMSRFDFTKCVYEDNACMDLLDPEDAIAGLKELGL